MSSHARARSRFAVTVGVMALVVTSVQGTVARDGRESLPTWPTREAPPTDRVLVEFDDDVPAARRRDIAGDHGLRRVDQIADAGIEVLAAKPGKAATAVKALRGYREVVDVSTDDPLALFADPTLEPGFELQWGLHNVGQTINGYPGVPDVDIDGPEALALSTGDPAVVVAVIDNGVDFSHPDLAPQAWTNPNEAPNGLDDDANGIVDDIHGANFCASPATGVVYQSGEWHGTHVAGTIAASLDGVGVVGVAPSVRIMALRFICGETGSTASAIKAIQYAKAHGVRIANASWGGGFYNSTLANAIANSGLLFVASAGNGGFDDRGDDNDATPTYPASYPAPNILSVAAVHNEGGLSSFSNYGRTSVDISAPGEDILSTVPAAVDCLAPCYGWSHGTSMAAPHVTGVAALAASVSPSLRSDPVALKARVLGTGSYLPATAGRTVTGRLVNAHRALDVSGPAALAPDGFSFPTGSTIGSSINTRVRWPAATDDLSGVQRYTVGQSVNDGAYSTVTSSATGLWIDRSLAFQSRNRFRVRATDRAGNTGGYAIGPQVQPKLYQQTTSYVTYGGTWRTSTSSSYSGGSTRYATTKGAWVQFSFSGRAVAVIAPKSTSRGSVKVYVDGVYVSTVSTYRSSAQNRVVIFAKHWSTPGPHTVKLFVAGTSGHPRFDIDAFAKLN